MELTQEQINENIQRLRNKVGDARTGGKGSQRRKVKIVSKTNVRFRSIRVVVISLLKAS
jgi:hypothetical protein